MIKVLGINTVLTDQNGIAQVIFNLNDNINHDEIIFDLLSINDPAHSFYERIKRYGGCIYVSKRSSLFKYIKTLYSIIKKNKYDIIHVHGNSSSMLIEMIVAKCAGCNIRITHSHNTTSNHPHIHRLLRPLFNRFVTGRLACGIDAGNWMYGKSNFVVVNNGINTERFRFKQRSRDNIRTILSVEKDTILLGHVGFFNDQKNHMFLLDCFKAIRDISDHYKLLLLGDGPNREQIEKRIAKYGLKDFIYMPGLVDNIEDYLSAMDAIVMPSLYEGLPLAMIEEQANGLFCFVADTITKEVDKTRNILFLPLQNGPEQWGKTILNTPLYSNRNEISDKAIIDITKSGYDIKKEGVKMGCYYKKQIKEIH